MSPKFLRRSLLAFLSVVLVLSPAYAQDIHLNVYYVCDVGRVMIEGCEMANTSDKGECFVEYTDKMNANGSPTMKSVPRGELRKYLASCKQPAADSVAHADANRKRQQDQQDAIQQKNLAMMKQPAGDPRYKDPESRQMARCLTSGRLPASCLGNQLSKGFDQFMAPGVEMANQMLGTTGKNAISLKPITGPYIFGVFVGAGGWYLDFTDQNVQAKCSDVSAWPDKYSVDFRPSGAFVTVQVNPRPLVLALRSDGKALSSPPGPFVLDGFVPDGSSGGGAPGHFETRTTTSHQELTGNEATQYGGNSNLTNKGEGTYDLKTTHTSTEYVGGGMPNRPTYHSKRVTCPAANLSNQGASAGEKTIETNFLKSMMGSGTGAPTPPGIRMNGIYANASTGFSAQFFPESVILGCGPDAARAYPYTVTATGGGATIQIAANDHPLSLALRPDGALDPRSSDAFQVHGRYIASHGNNGSNDNLTYGPLERTCNLGVLTPASAIPSNGGESAAPTRSVAADPPTLSTPTHVLGNATLSITSALAAQPGQPSPLAGRFYVLMRHSVPDILRNLGIAIPPGSSAFKVLGLACMNHTPDCQRINDAVKADAASGARADATGAASLPGLPPGTYHLMITARYNNQPIAWTQPIELHAGPNSLALSTANATPIQ